MKLPDKARGRPARNALIDSLSPAVTLPDPADVASLLALSRERDLWLERVLDAERRGYARGRADGIDEGYRQAEAERAAEWHRIAHPIAYPEAHERESAARRLRAAAAGERRDQAEHERSFVARAFSTPPDQRTEVQRGAVQLYPPPPGMKARAA